MTNDLFSKAPTKCGLGLLFVGFATLSACGGSSVALKQTARAELQCKQHIDHEDMGGWVEKVSGCGRSSLLAKDDGVWTSARDAAVEDLRCERAELDTTVIDKGAVAVSGCDQSAIYLLRASSCQGYGCKRGWQSPTKKARFDLKCKDDGLEMTHLEKHRLGVSCGERTAIYEWEETGYKTRNFAWRRAWD